MELVEGRLKQGGLRLTSYEAGVLYAAAQDAARRTGDDRYRKFVENRLLTMASLVPKMRDSLLRNKNYDRQMRPLVLPHSLDDAGAMCAAYCRLQLSTPLPHREGAGWFWSSMATCPASGNSTV